MHNEGLAQAFCAAVHVSNDAVVVMSAAGAVEYANAVARELFGIGDDLKRVSVPVRALLRAQIVAAASFTSEGEDAHRRPCRLTRPDGTGVEVWHSVVVCDGEDDVVRYVLVTDPRGVDSQSSEAARGVDQLTGLADRTQFIERLRARSRQGAVRPEPYAVLFCDLDGFKLVNDTHGHHVGDKLLDAIAKRLTGLVRSGDIVARLGGDEFVILLDALDKPSRAQAVASRIVDQISEPVTIGDTRIKVGASIGIAVTRDDQLAAQDLLARADAAMYEAKQNGKGRIAQYGAALDQRIADRRDLSRELSVAIESQSLALWYRPVIDLGTGAVTSLEASLRWNHATRGLLTPDAFVEVAQATGLAGEIDRFVIAMAGRDAATWRRDHPDLRVWVTLSGRQLSHADGAQRLAATLKGAETSCIGIEVDEEAIATDYVTLHRVLLELAASGIDIALDNFRGKLTVHQLQALRLRMVKLDRSFLAHLGDDIESARAVRSVAGMIRPLGITMVAKGVDTPEQLAAVINLNCDAAQGTIAGQPVPAAAVRLDRAIGNVA